MALFTEDSDSDSIATNTTAESEHSDDEGFNVEQILAEDVDEHGAKTYLVKWEGYPLHRCTWESREQFGSNAPLNAWRERKREAASGGRPLFDPDEFFEAVEKADDEKEERARRRALKRKKRNKIQSRSQSPVKASGTTPAVQCKPSIVPTVHKKGIAKKLVKTSKPAPPPATKAPAAAAPLAKAKVATEPVQASNRSSQPARKTAPSGSTPAPLIGPDIPDTKRRQRPLVSSETPKDSTGRRFKNLSTQNKFQKHGRNEPAPDRSTLVFIDPETGKRRNTATPASEKSVPSRLPPGQDSEPSVAPSEPQRPSKLAERAPQPQQRREPGDTSSEAQTASRTIDIPTPPPARRSSQPETRQHPPPLPSPPPPPELPKHRDTIAAVETGHRAKDIHSAYGRRSPPRARRRRSPDPEPAAVVTAFPPDRSKKKVTCKDWQAGSCSWPPGECRFLHGYNRPTCHFWRTGNRCKFSAEQCDYAHWDTGEDSSEAGSKTLTCFFWRQRGRCTKGNDCAFAHWDTGVWAPQPRDYQGQDGDLGSNPPAFQNDPPPQNAFEPSAGSLSTRVATSATPPAHSPVTRDSSISSLTRHASEAITRDAVQGLVPEVPPALQPTVGASALITKPSSIRDPTTGADVVQAWEAIMTDVDLPSFTQRIQEDLEVAKKSIRELRSSTFLLKNGKFIENVYVLMSEEREEERKLLVDFIRGMNCRVFHSGIAQHWDLFQKNSNSSLVVIHPDELFNGTIPNFGSYLLRGKGQVFSIGVHTDWINDDEFTRKYDARRVFPQSGMTFITDDIFEYFPEKALEIIEEFLSKAKTKPSGAETSKIAARPGIKDWLYELARRKADEGGDNYKDDRYVKNWLAIDALCPLELYDPCKMQDGDMMPLEEAWLWSLPEEYLPSFKGLWEEDEAKATNYMADLFAGTAVERKAEFQRFCFIYQRPDDTAVADEVPASQLPPQATTDRVDPKGWMKMYNHIEVMTPDAWLKMTRSRL